MPGNFETRQRQALSTCQRAWEDPGDLFDCDDDPGRLYAVRRWPDGTWVLEDDYKEQDYLHMSDDFEIVHLTGEEPDELL